MATKKKEEKCSLFEEMLMWTSYRYCIGRHTYVTSMAQDIASHYYNKLSPERREFTASDIRREIMDRLKWLPFNFEIHRVYNYDEFNPLDVLFTFINEQKITSFDEFVKYSKIIYHSHENKFEFDKCEPTIKSYFTEIEITDLIPWNDLASCFDVKNHKIIVTEHEGKQNEYRCFKSWRQKTSLIESKDGHSNYKIEFGWTPVWVVLDSYLKTSYCGYIPSESVKEIKDIKTDEI